MSPEPPRNEFERAAAEQQSESIIREFWSFLSHNKKWWLLPILAMMLILGILVFLSQSAAAPFIYTLF